jgi:hypothetical protein
LTTQVVMLTGSNRLLGPNAAEAAELALRALSLTADEARLLSDAYETDRDPRYLDNCAVVQGALDASRRSLPAGWFEQAFKDCSWAYEAKTLDAVADAIVSVLVRDVAPKECTALSRPWGQVRRD